MSSSNETLSWVDTTSQEWEDLQSDVAENYSRERMQVGVKGRMTYQKILVRSTNNNGSKTTVKYEPTTDSAAQSTQSILPTREEKQESEGDDGTITMLVVGLVIAEDPMKYSNVGTLKGKEKEEKRKARGILPLPAKVVRAVVQASQHTSSSFKYYVAVDTVKGLCELRLIRGEAVFFFPEFLASISEKISIRSRQQLIPRAIRAAAAAIGEDVSGDSDDGVGPGDQDVEMLEDLPTESTADVPALARLESEDLRVFLDSDNKTFSVEDASLMLKALGLAKSTFLMTPTVVVRVRQVLQHMDLLGRLSQEVIPLFVKMLNTNVDRVDSSQFEYYIQITVDMTLCAAENQL